LSINNLFDTDPPEFADASAAVFQYDLFGRYYTIIARARF
jgi:outer membrane receptor protein involved in Fe transport